MEHWHHTATPPVKAEDGDIVIPSRILTSTSGNARTYALDTRQGTENQDAVGNSSVLPTYLKAIPSQQLIGPTLTSNTHQASLARLQARRQRRDHLYGYAYSADKARPYLTSKKYIDYRNRQRQDTGADGKPVWDNFTEAAFQDALCEIEPMGRKKRTQLGRPYGRNELIAEFILARTGQHRTRKQVSSHIQVLQTILKGTCPEWDALMKADEKADRQGSENHQYYGNSVQDLVRRKYHGVHPDYARPHYSDGHIPPPAFTLGSNVGHVEKHLVNKLNFLMWVSPPHPTPDEIKKQIHRYTEVQCHHLSSQPIPLESSRNWRVSFPHLVPIVDHLAFSQDCDIILVEASFRLMPDFPPPSCKLGINLELDFRHPTNANMKALGELHHWTWVCVTRMYENGRCFRESRQHCDLRKQKLDVGTVAPSFESAYWATKFVKLIEKKRGAEESGNPSAISAADEASRKFFSGLTGMQELVAYTPHETSLLGTQAKQPKGKRMVILLWKFSQVQSDFVGTTTWKRLVPPPPRVTLNSPPATQDLALPALTMDTMVEDMRDDPNLTSYKEAHSQQGQQDSYHFYDTGLDEDTGLMCHDEYDMEFKDEDMAALDAMQTSFGMPSSHRELISSSLQDLEHFPFQYQHGMDIGEEPTHAGSSNLFEMHEDLHPSHLHASSSLHISQGLHHQPDTSEESSTRDENRQPLNAFDHNTHRVLQAQLEQHNVGNHDLDDSALQEALIAAAAMNDLGAHTSLDYMQAQQRHSHEQSGCWETEFPSRPPLPHQSSYMSHHSHHSAVNEDVAVPINQEAFDANQFVGALINHGSSTTVLDNGFEHPPRSPLDSTAQDSCLTFHTMTGDEADDHAVKVEMVETQTNVPIPGTSTAGLGNH